MNIHLARHFGTLSTLLDFDTVAPIIPAQVAKTSSQGPLCPKSLAVATGVGETLAREYIKRSMAPHAAGRQARTAAARQPKESADDAEGRRLGRKLQTRASTRTRWEPATRKSRFTRAMEKQMAKNSSVNSFLARMSPSVALDGEIKAHALRDEPFEDRLEMLAQSRERQADPLYQGAQTAKALAIAGGAGGLTFATGPAALNAAVNKAGWSPATVQSLVKKRKGARAAQTYSALAETEAYRDIKAFNVGLSPDSRKMVDDMVGRMKSTGLEISPGADGYADAARYLNAPDIKVRNNAAGAAARAILDGGRTPYDAARILLDPNERALRPEAFGGMPKARDWFFPRQLPKELQNFSDDLLQDVATRAGGARQAARVLLDDKNVVPRTLEGAVLRLGEMYGALNVPQLMSSPLGFGQQHAGAETGVAGALRKAKLTNRVGLGLLGAGAGAAYSLPRLSRMRERSQRPRDMESLSLELQGDDVKAEAMENAERIAKRMAAERKRATGRLTVSVKDFTNEAKSVAPEFTKALRPSPKYMDDLLAGTRP